MKKLEISDSSAFEDAPLLEEWWEHNGREWVGLDSSGDFGTLREWELTYELLTLVKKTINDWIIKDNPEMWGTDYVIECDFRGELSAYVWLEEVDLYLADVDRWHDGVYKKICAYLSAKPDVVLPPTAPCCG